MLKSVAGTPRKDEAYLHQHLTTFIAELSSACASGKKLKVHHANPTQTHAINSISSLNTSDITYWAGQLRCR
jgi:hypothetical protein